MGTFFECSDSVYLCVKRLLTVGTASQTGVIEVLLVWRCVHNQDLNGLCTFASSCIAT